MYDSDALLVSGLSHDHPFALFYQKPLDALAAYENTMSLASTWKLLSYHRVVAALKIRFIYPELECLSLTSDAIAVDNYEKLGKKTKRLHSTFGSIIGHALVTRPEQFRTASSRIVVYQRHLIQ